MKLLLFLISFIISISAINPQEQKADKNFFLGKWNCTISGHALSIDFKDGSTSVWYTDSSAYFPEGLELKYSLDLAAYPYKISFFNPANPNGHLNTYTASIKAVVASIEVINQGSFKFIGEKVIYKNGKEEKPKENEAVIIFSRVIN